MKDRMSRPIPDLLLPQDGLHDPCMCSSMLPRPVRLLPLWYPSLSGDLLQRAGQGRETIQTHIDHASKQGM